MSEQEHKKGKTTGGYLKPLVISLILLGLGIAGLATVAYNPLPHIVGAAIGIVSCILGIAGALGVWAILDSIGMDDDDDGPHFYGPGGSVL